MLAYFNTYYNAKKTFDEAVEETQKTQSKISQTNLFTFPTVPQTARTKFLSVIEKCSKIIQFYPKSSKVDDALLLIGKSYYYLNELLPAQKKFTELLENFPTTDLRFEAKLGLAKAHHASQKVEEALTVLKSLVTESQEANEHDIAIEALLLEGQIYVDRQDYAHAITSYLQAVEIPGNDKLLAIAQYQLAYSYELKGDADSASRAYVKVLDFNPDFSLGYQVRLRSAVMYSAIGDFARAINLLGDLSGESLTAEDRSYVELEFGNVYQLAGDYDKALEHYNTVDSLYKRTDAAAKSYYQRGLMYEKRILNLQEAKLYYDKAKSEFPQSEVTAPAAKKSEVLSRYLIHRTELSKYDSLLQLALHPELLSISADTLQHSADTGESHLPIEQMRSDSVRSLKAIMVKDSIQTMPVGKIPIDTIHQRRATNQFALGVLFFVDLDRPDSAAHWLNAMLKEYPDSKLSPQALYALAEIYRSKQQASAADSIYNILLTKYPDSEYSRNTKKLSGTTALPLIPDSAEMSYVAAEKLFEEGNLRTALQKFKQIAARYPSTSFGAKARYTVGWMYENIFMNTDSAAAHYRLLLQEQPVSVYADRVRPKLAMKDNPESGGKQSLESSTSKPKLESSETGKDSTQQRSESKIPFPEKPKMKTGEQKETNASPQKKKDEKP